MFSFRQFLIESNGSSTSFTAFHAANLEKANEIAKNGFYDPVSGKGNEFAGTGIYFFENEKEVNDYINDYGGKGGCVIQVEIDGKNFVYSDFRNENIYNAFINSYNIDSKLLDWQIDWGKFNWNGQLNIVAPNFPFEEMEIPRNGHIYNLSRDIAGQLHLDKFVPGIVIRGKGSGSWIIVYDINKIKLLKIGCLENNNIVWRDINDIKKQSQGQVGKQGYNYYANKIKEKDEELKYLIKTTGKDTNSRDLINKIADLKKYYTKMLSVQDENQEQELEEEIKKLENWTERMKQTLMPQKPQLKQTVPLNQPKQQSSDYFHLDDWNLPVVNY